MSPGSYQILPPQGAKVRGEINAKDLRRESLRENYRIDYLGENYRMDSLKTGNYLRTAEKSIFTAEQPDP